MLVTPTTLAYLSLFLVKHTARSTFPTGSLEENEGLQRWEGSKDRGKARKKGPGELEQYVCSDAESMDLRAELDQI